MISDHLANQNIDQNLFSASQFNEKYMSNAAHHANIIKCKIFAFLRLYKSIQKNKNITDTTTIKNDNNDIYNL